LVGSGGEEWLPGESHSFLVSHRSEDSSQGDDSVGVLYLPKPLWDVHQPGNGKNREKAWSLWTLAIPLDYFPGNIWGDSLPVGFSIRERTQDHPFLQARLVQGTKLENSTEPPPGSAINWFARVPGRQSAAMAMLAIIVFAVVRASVLYRRRVIVLEIIDPSGKSVDRISASLKGSSSGLRAPIRRTKIKFKNLDLDRDLMVPCTAYVRDTVFLDIVRHGALFYCCVWGRKLVGDYYEEVEVSDKAAYARGNFKVLRFAWHRSWMVGAQPPRRNLYLGTLLPLPEKQEKIRLALSYAWKDCLLLCCSTALVGFAASCVVIATCRFFPMHNWFLGLKFSSIMSVSIGLGLLWCSLVIILDFMWRRVSAAWRLSVVGRPSSMLWALKVIPFVSLVGFAISSLVVTVGGWGSRVYWVVLVACMALSILVWFGVVNGVKSRFAKGENPTGWRGHAAGLWNILGNVLFSGAP